MKKRILKKILCVEEERKNEEEEKSEKKCHYCGTSLIIQPRQTRSADEGMTVFYLCLKCPRTIKK